MIKVIIDIEERDVGPNKTAGQVAAATFSKGIVTKEERGIRDLILDNIKKIGEEMGKLKGSRVKIIEGEIKPDGKTGINLFEGRRSK